MYMCGGRWVPSVRAQLAAGPAEVHVRTRRAAPAGAGALPTTDLSIRMMVLKDHLQAH